MDERMRLCSTQGKAHAYAWWKEEDGTVIKQKRRGYANNSEQGGNEKQQNRLLRLCASHIQSHS